MQVPVQIPAVWVQTTSDVNNVFRPEGYPSFLTPYQQARAERIRQSRMLFDGQHRQYFLTENRTQSDFSRMVAGDRPIQPYIAYNVLELISNTGTDLLLAEEPMIRAADPYQQKALQELSERCMLHPLLYSGALSSSAEGDAYFEACVFDGEVCLRQVPGEEIFPIGQIQPNGQYRSYVRFNLKNMGSVETPIWLLRQITYSPGKIERECWQLDKQGKKQNRVGLDVWLNCDDVPVPPPAIPANGYSTGPLGYDNMPPNPEDPQNDDPIPVEQLRAVTMTGIDQCTITWIPNRVIRNEPASDYGNLIDLQDMLNFKTTQLACIFAKHADPAIAFPQEAADDQGNARAANKVFFFGDGPDRIPKYITWDAEVKAAMDDRDFALTNLIVAAESSPVLLGVKSDGVKAIAYKSIKLMSIKAITKAKRKSLYWKAGIARMLSVAQALEVSVVPGTRYDTAPIAVELQDGIPNDSLDTAQEIALLMGSKAMSQDRAVRIQIQDPAAADAELAQLQTEAEAATPSTFFPGAPGAPETPPDVEGKPAGSEVDAPAEVTADKTEVSEEVET